MPEKEVIANSRLIKETAAELKVDVSQVRDCIEFYGNFISTTIKSGRMEGITIPYIGKFQVKLANQQYKSFFNSLTPEQKKFLKESPHFILDELKQQEDGNGSIYTE